MKHNQRQIPWLIAAGVICSLPATAAEMVPVSDSNILEQALSLQAQSVAPVDNGFQAVKSVQLPNGQVRVR